MREALRRLGAESAVYGLGQVGGRAVQLLLVPILTRALSQEAFGIAELVIGYSQTALLILVMGMDGALARFFYQEPDRESRIRMVSSSLAFRLATSVAAALALVLFSGPLAEQLMSGAAYRKYLIIGAAGLPLALLVMFGNDVLRVTFQPWKYIALNITQVVLVTGLSLYFVLAMKVGVVGVLYGRVFGDALASALGLVLIRHSVRPRFSRATLRRMLGYGVPAVPAAFAFGVIGAVDRYVLQRTRSLEELAVYAVAIKFFSVVTIAASAFQLAYGPFAFSYASKPDAPRLYARVLAAYIAAGCLGALMVGAFVPDALRVLVPPQYYAAALPAVLLCFAAVALGAYTVTSLGIGLALRTPLLSWCSGAGALVAIVAHTLLTPRFGPQGAAAATLMGYVATALVTYRVAQHVHPLPYRGGRLAALFAAALALGIGVAQWAPVGWRGVPLKLLAATAFTALALGLRVLWNEGAVAPERPAPSAAR